MNLNIPHFNIDKFQDNQHVIIFGNDKEINQKLIKNLFYYKRSIENGVVCTQNPKRYPYVSKYSIYSYFHVNTITANQSKKQLILIDQCFNYPSSYSAIAKDIESNGKNTTVIYNINENTALERTFTKNIDWIFLFKNNYQKFYQKCKNKLPELRVLKSIMDAIDENEECLIININSDQALDKKVFWLKIDDITTNFKCFKKTKSETETKTSGRTSRGTSGSTSERTSGGIIMKAHERRKLRISCI